MRRLLLVLLVPMMFPGLVLGVNITSFSVRADQQVEIVHSSNTNSYYILLRGNSPLFIDTIVDLKPGVAPVSALSDRPSNFSAVFYRVREVSLRAPVDSDSDGIDDAYELTHGGLLNALDGNDANADP